MQINTVGVGVAYGQCCMLLAAGTKGKRFMLPHATAMLQQPRVPPTGARQATEVQIKWREVLAQQDNFLEILSIHTGHSLSKLDSDMQRCALPVECSPSSDFCDQFRPLVFLCVFEFIFLGFFFFQCLCFNALVRPCACLLVAWSALLQVGSNLRWL